MAVKAAAGAGGLLGSDYGWLNLYAVRIFEPPGISQGINKGHEADALLRQSAKS
jgi:hypothetical protein